MDRVPGRDLEPGRRRRMNVPLLWDDEAGPLLKCSVQTSSVVAGLHHDL